jgi:sulfonate transport system permease protein
MTITTASPTTPELTASVIAVTPVALEDPTGNHRRARKQRRVPPWARRLSGPILLLATWELVVATHLVDRRSLVGPGAVVGAARELWSTGELQRNILSSLSLVCWGLGIGVVVGLLLAVTAGFFRVGEDVLDSSMNILRTVPVVALLPLIIV